VAGSAELRARDYYDAIEHGAPQRQPSLSHRNDDGPWAEKAECWRARRAWQPPDMWLG
jgi:hypothetical protein